MDILPLPNGGLRFLEMPAAFYEQLSLLSQTCDPDDDPTIVSRLYPHPLDPSEALEDREKAEKDHVQSIMSLADKLGEDTDHV